MSRTDRDELWRIHQAACARLDARTLAATACEELPEGTRLFGLGKVAHVQLRAALAARPDLQPIVSVSTEAGPEDWALAGDHPIPNERSFVAGEALLERVAAIDGAPIALFLSGGGSALAEVAAPGLDEWELVRAHRTLLGAGLDIDALNVVRRKLSGLKGGRLAAAAPRSSWHVFVCSDVVGDDLSTIASGPCAPDLSRPHEALRICREAGILDELPPGVRTRLDSIERPPSLAGIELHSRILAGPRQLAFAADAVATLPASVLAPIVDDVEEVANRYSTWARDRAGSGPALLVAAGEPKLKVEGRGRGGRAQHLALLVAERIAGLDATFLAAGTDGRDGETDHAGAVVDGFTASAAGDRLTKAIRAFDSAPLHAALGTAIPRFDAVTHLGELHLLLIR